MEKPKVKSTAMPEVLLSHKQWEEQMYIGKRRIMESDYVSKAPLETYLNAYGTNEPKKSFVNRLLQLLQVA